MTGHSQKKRYPLHIHIATLFTMLILVVGVTLAWFSYRQISSLAFDTTEILFTQTSEELVLQFQKDYRPVATSVRLLANSALSEADSLQERMKHLPLLAEIIRDETQITAFHVGYADGDLIVMAALNNDHIRTVFAAPDAARYVIIHIDHNDDGDAVSFWSVAGTSSPFVDCSGFEGNTSGLNITTWTVKSPSGVAFRLRPRRPRWRERGARNSGRSSSSMARAICR